MATVRRQLHHQGFTLIEMLIVICVIAIMALIVIPRVQSAIYKAKEATFRANLRQLRAAVASFETDTGIYPLALRDVVAPSNDPTRAGTTSLMNAGSYKGPYLTPNGGLEGSGIPVNPFAPMGASAMIETHWEYTPGSGIVTSKVSGTTLEGEALTDL